jgi:hypothetical protein
VAQVSSLEPAVWALTLRYCGHRQDNVDDIPLLVKFIKNDEITHEIPTLMG